MKLDWFLKVARIAGSAFPTAAPFVQLQAELDSDGMKRRITRLEDPISHLHADIPEISRIIYLELSERDSVNLTFDDDFYRRYGRGLAALEAQKLVSIDKAIGRQVPLGINLTEPSYIVYLCTKHEDQGTFCELVNTLEACGNGQTLDAVLLSESLGVAKYAIRAFFQIYEAKGFGYCSGGLRQFRYTGKA